MRQVFCNSYLFNLFMNYLYCENKRKIVWFYQTLIVLSMVIMAQLLTESPVTYK